MKILGIDAGSYALKGIELDVGKKAIKVRQAREVLLEDRTLKDAMEELVASFDGSADQVVMAIPNTFTTFRYLEVPSKAAKNRRELPMVILNELEESLPFEVDEAWVEWSVGEAKGELTSVFAHVGLKSRMLSYLNPFVTGQPDPDIITTEAWGLRSVYNRLVPLEAQLRPVMMIHMGHERTLLYVHHRGRQLSMKELAWGSRDLTLLLSRELRISPDAAEDVKRSRLDLKQGRFEEGSAEKELVLLSEQGYFNFVQELIQMDLATKGLAGTSLERLFLTGAGALVQGLPEWIGRRTRLPTELLPVERLLEGGGGDTFNARFALAVGLALAPTGADQRRVVNFRKGELERTGRPANIHFEPLKAPLIAGCVTSLFFMLSSGLQMGGWEKRHLELEKRLEKDARALLSQTHSVNQVAKLLEEPEAFKKALDAAVTRSEGLLNLSKPHPRSPLLVLKSMSESIPKDLVCELMHFEVGSDPAQPFAPDLKEQSAKAEFWVADPGRIPRLLEVLKFGPFQDLTHKLGAEVETKLGKRVKLHVEGTLKEALYGK